MGEELMDQMELEKLAESKIASLKKFLSAQPPKDNGEKVLELWDELYDESVQNAVVETLNGPSSEEEPVFPYEKIEAIVGDGGNWKWPRMWTRLDELERRGEAYREGEKLNLEQANKAPNSNSQRIFICGGGPIGLRLAIELQLGGHQVSVYEKRREVRDDAKLVQLGFTNRINRPHMWMFVRNDLARLNGRDFLEQKCQYPVFTEPETSSIGIDELQCLLLKNALLLGVDFVLGGEYLNAESVIPDRDTMVPEWKIEVKLDQKAAAKKKVNPGSMQLSYDVLIGCDGPRSTVRETMTKYLGDVEKRKFADCVGIVANVRKLSRKRLKELGYDYGQEPNDMNRTKLVFKDFFKKINEEADADLEGLIYYKCGYHNYCILTPKRANLIKHGLSGKVYNLVEAREALDESQDPKFKEKAEEKIKLKEYARRILKAAGIPVDPELPNGGFVDAPNDCMSFDFATTWNSKRGIAFELPPPGYSAATDGAYSGHTPFPIVALAGDSLLEPFWPQGLGLKRGFHSVLDTCWLIDNIYNPEASQRILKQDQVTWDEHFDTLKSQCQKHFEWCKAVRVTDEVAKGFYDEKGPVVTQLKKHDRDMEIPPYEVEIDPWTRYRELERECVEHWKYGLVGDEKETWQHPVVKKAIAKQKFDAEMRKGSKSDEWIHHGKPLLVINNKKVLHHDTGNTSSAGAKPAIFAKAAKPPGSKRHLRPPLQTAEPLQVDQSTLAKAALEKRESIVSKAFETALDSTIASSQAANKPKLPPGALPALPVAALAEAAHANKADEGHQEMADKLWAKMNGTHLESPQAQAELAKIQAMIKALQTSLDAYKQAEHNLLVSGSLPASTNLPI